MIPRMRTMLAATIVAFMLPLTAMSQDKPCPKPQSVDDVLFKPGDTWTYATRPEDPQSTLTILKVESTNKLGVFVHIRVNSVRIRTADGSELNTVAHMPISREALVKSVERKQQSGSVPDFHDGYADWREHCGGVFTISVAEAIATMQSTTLHGAHQ